jgi:hypothetical protein
MSSTFLQLTGRKTLAPLPNNTVKEGEGAGIRSERPKPFSDTLHDGDAFTNFYKDIRK